MPHEVGGGGGLVPFFVCVFLCVLLSSGIAQADCYLLVLCSTAVHTRAASTDTQTAINLNAATVQSCVVIGRYMVPGQESLEFPAVWCRFFFSSSFLGKGAFSMKSLWSPTVLLRQACLRSRARCSGHIRRPQCCSSMRRRHIRHQLHVPNHEQCCGRNRLPRQLVLLWATHRWCRRGAGYEHNDAECCA